MANNWMTAKRYYSKEDEIFLDIADLFGICDEKENFESWMFDNIHRYDLLEPVYDD